MSGKETKKCGAQKQAAGQSQSPASDKEIPIPDKNESNDVQTGPAPTALLPPKEEKQAESALTEESKEGAAASEMQPTLAEIKPELPVFDGALVLGKEHETEKSNTTEGDSSPVLMTSEDPTAKAADKEEKATATAEPVVNVDVEDGKELKQSLGEAVDDQAGLPSNATHETGSRKSGADAEDNKDRPSKRFRSAQDIDVRLLLPHKAFQLIIGSAGDNIKQLKSEHKADFFIPDNRGAPEGVLVISGSRDVVCEGLLDVILLSKVMSPILVNCHEIRFLFPQGLVDLLISNGGTRLQQLRMNAGCQIKIFVDYAPFSLERVVEMSGDAKQVVVCVSDLWKTMADVLRKEVKAQYNPKNVDECNASGYGGYVDERARGKPAKTRAAEVFLQQELVGALLGENGSRIRQARNESGAKIAVNHACEGSAERVISIDGTAEQINYAKYLLQIVLRRHA